MPRPLPLLLAITAALACVAHLVFALARPPGYLEFMVGHLLGPDLILRPTMAFVRLAEAFALVSALAWAWGRGFFSGPLSPGRFWRGEPHWLWGFNLTALALIAVWAFFTGLGRGPSLFIEDGLLEYATALLLILAGLFLLYTALKSEATRLERGLLCLFGLGFLAMAGEEMSWGQRIFGWETTGFFLRYNQSRETNLHNLFNPYLDLGYGLAAMALGWVLLFRNRIAPRLPSMARLLPPGGFAVAGVFYLGAVFLQLAGAFKWDELVEIASALFALAYALALPASLRASPPPNPARQEA